MERTDVLAMMGELKLYGMRNAYDELLATALKRQHEPQRVIGDFLAAEVAEKQKMLEVADLRERANLLLAYLTKELQMLEMKNQGFEAAKKNDASMKAWLSAFDDAAHDAGHAYRHA